MTDPRTPPGRPGLARLAVLAALASPTLAGGADDEHARGEAPDFARSVRPLLSDRCFQCHGPDEETREAGLRLDRREQVFGDLGGYSAVVPGAPEESELWLRISDPDDPMPPEGAEKRLAPEEIELLRRWIEAGAPWDEHWAYMPPRRPALPAVDDDAWARNPVDRFVLARLRAAALEPEPEAAPATLVRRLSLDLTGLPPTPAEVDAFLADAAPGAYERLVERLLASPRHGEHLARAWLDAVRYGDTHGFHLDNERRIWPYRDWVIDAFQRNVPFDRFTVEQLAGDLLPEPTLEQRVATGFVRMNPTTAEGGFIEEEYRVKYAVDRVETVSTVWLGSTLACAQCHDHKFDPVSQEEFYGLFAFFNSTAEAVSDGNQPSPGPVVQVPSEAQRLARATLEERLAEAERRFAEPLPEVDAGQAAWEAGERARRAERWRPLEVLAATARSGARLVLQPDGSLLATGENPDQDAYEVLLRAPLERLTALRLEVLPDPSLPHGGVGRADNGNFVLTEVAVEAAPDPAAGGPGAFEPVPLAALRADHEQEGWPAAAALDGEAPTGWAVDARRDARVAYVVADAPFGAPGGSLVRVRLSFDSIHARHAIGRFRLAASADPALAPARPGSWWTLGPFREEHGDVAFDTDYGFDTAAEPFDPDRDAPDGLTWTERPEYADAAVHGLGEVEHAAVYLYRRIDAAGPRRLTLALGSDDALKVWCNGVELLAERVPRGAARDQDRVTLDLAAGANHLLLKVVNYGGPTAFAAETVAEELGGVPLAVDLALAREVPGEADARLLREHYRSTRSPAMRALLEDAARAREELSALDAEIPTTLVAEERAEPLPAHVLVRGRYDRPADEVAPGTPACLPPLEVAGERPTRLDLARWLVSPDHPLTARVTVNRLWQELFGRGLVATPEDFGAQGAFPSHPELLDWLAVELVEGGWDLRALLRTLVTSATYRQRTACAPAKRAADPRNLLLARGPRFRLDAERIRDSVLHVSGLLVERVGGPPVRPYQPEGIWEAVAYTSSNTARYERDEGDALWRRSLYTFWKRTAPPAAMQILDAPSRESCTVGRARTNTPLQALALLNDTQYVEAARHFAASLVASEAADDEERLVHAFRRAVARRPSEDELAILLHLLADARATYAAAPEDAAALLAVGASPPSTGAAPAELAAWTVVGNTLLNLDELVTRP